MRTITSCITTPPLTVPHKKSDPFDWIAHGRYILQEAKVPPDHHTAELHELNSQRSRCLGCGADRIGMQLHAKYYQQLARITERFVVVDVAEGRGGFKWSDAYDSTLSMEQTSVAYEKANVLFNSAAILSQMAASLPAATEDDLNGMFTAFLGSASIFHYIKEHFLHPPLHDISKPSLEFITQLMMAQAQEAAARKAVLSGLSQQQQQSGDNGMSCKLLARLWQSSAVHYATALKFWYAPNADKLRENVQGSVPQLVDQKYRLSSVLALYYSAQWAHSKERVGEAIARLHTGLSMCQEAGGQGALGKQFSSLQDEVLKELKDKYEKENNLIFHQHQPAVLPEIEPASLVHLSSADKILAEYGGNAAETDLFHAVVPQHVRVVGEKFKEEAQKLVRYEEHLVEQARKELAACQDQLAGAALFGLPKEYLEARLGDEVQKQAAAAVKGDLASDLVSRATRLREILRSDLEANLDTLKATGRRLFDAKLVDGEARRETIERIDIAAAVFESLVADLDATLVPEFGGQLLRMEQLVKAYAAGDYGDLKVPDLSADTDDEPSPRLDRQLFGPVESALQHLRTKVEEDDITEDVLKAGRGHGEETIQKRLRSYDPLASAIEKGLDKVREAVAEANKYLDRRRSKFEHHQAFQEMEQQIEKRKILISVYQTQVSKPPRDQLRSIQTIKSEIDAHREEFQSIVELVDQSKRKEPKDAPRAHLQNGSREEQALKDREYMMQRLKQLGLAPDQ